MNWFQRYGIPGAYFVSLIVIWIMALYPCIFNNFLNKNKDDLQLLIAIAGISFLPLGYIISIFEQYLYLNEWFFPKKPKKWKIFQHIHKRAKDESGLQFKKFFDIEEEPDDPTRLEAYSLLLSIWKDKNTKKNIMELEEQNWFQEWVRRRVDVIAINFTLWIATLIAPIMAIIIGCLICHPWIQPIWEAIGCLLIISGLIIWILILSIQTLSLQLVTAITEYYKQHQNYL